MIAALDDAEPDRNVLLIVEFGRQPVYRVQGHLLVLIAVDDQPRRGARGEEREVLGAGRRRHRDEASDFRAPHHQLHGDQRPEGIAADPAEPAVLVDLLHPVEGVGRVAQLADPGIEGALRFADAPEIEPEHREPPVGKRVEHRVDDAIVHVAAVEGVRMQHDRDGRVGRFTLMIAAFEAAVGTVEDNFGHWY